MDRNILTQYTGSSTAVNVGTTVGHMDGVAMRVLEVRTLEVGGPASEKQAFRIEDGEMAQVIIGPRKKCGEVAISGQNVYEVDGFHGVNLHIIGAGRELAPVDDRKTEKQALIELEKRIVTSVVVPCVCTEHSTVNPAPGCPYCAGYGKVQYGIDDVEYAV